MEEKYLKLTNAVYKLLEFFPESDPLKNRAKDKALAIMSRLSGIPPVAGENSIQKDIDILLGYLEIGKSQGWLNSINCLIIANEYEKIKKEIKPITNSTPEPVLNNTEPKTPDFSISARQKKILEFLSKNEKAQVMDLQTVLPDITKRTIRRDLDELLEAGKITRLGEFNQVFYKISGSPSSAS